MNESQKDVLAVQSLRTMMAGESYPLTQAAFEKFWLDLQSGATREERWMMEMAVLHLMMIRLHQYDDTWLQALRQEQAELSV